MSGSRPVRGGDTEDPDIDALLRAYAERVETDESFRESLGSRLDSAARPRARRVRILPAVMAAVAVAAALTLSIPGVTRAAGSWWRGVAVSVTQAVGRLPGGIEHLPPDAKHIHVQPPTTQPLPPGPQTVSPVRAAALAGFPLVTLHAGGLRLQSTQVLPMGSGRVRVAFIYVGSTGKEVVLTQNRFSGAPAAAPPGAEAVDINGSSGWLLTTASGGDVYWTRGGIALHLGGPVTGSQLLQWARTANG